MKVEVSLHGFGEWADAVVDLEEGATHLDLLRALEIPSETVVVFAGEEPVPEDEVVRPGVPIRLVRVISGGSRAFRG